MKKMVRENQQKRRDGGIVNRSDPNSADNDPVLLLPQLAKSDKLIYTPSKEDGCKHFLNSIYNWKKSKNLWKL